MDSKDAHRLDELSASLSSSHAAVQRARETVIESLGDHLCGDGAGPTPQELASLVKARRMEAKARMHMARFVAALARQLIERIRCRTRPRRNFMGRRDK